MEQQGHNLAVKNTNEGQTVENSLDKHERKYTEKKRRAGIPVKNPDFIADE